MQKVNELFKDLNNRNELKSEEIFQIRDFHLNPKEEEIVLDNIETIESTEEIITEEEIEFSEEYLEVLETPENPCDDFIEISKDDQDYEEFNEEVECEKDIKSQDQERKYFCTICSKAFKENRHLNVHMNTHLSEDKKAQHPCQICGKNYSSVFSLRHHVKVVHINQAAFNCHLCEKSFSRKANLESHLVSHSNDKPYSCDYCGLRLKTKGNLRVHKKIHSDDYVTCSICGKRFKTQNQLTNHKIIHSEEKKHSCEHCDASYKRSKELKNHLMSVHYNLRKHSCPWCPKTFVNNSNFRKHKKVMHRLELEEYERTTKNRFIDEEDVIVEENEIDVDDIN
jgi:DNA-directed RNA polymerase subunit RPC12/RpoP